MKELEKILNGNKALNITFFDDIKKIIEEKHLSYIDAVLDYCDKNNLEIETVATLIKSNSKIKSEIMIEAQDLNMLKEKPARLILEE